MISKDSNKATKRRYRNKSKPGKNALVDKIDSPKNTQSVKQNNGILALKLGDRKSRKQQAVYKIFHCSAIPCKIFMVVRMRRHNACFLVQRRLNQRQFKGSSTEKDVNL